MTTGGGSGDGGSLLDCAEWAVGELKGAADYVQAFAESTVEIRIESVDGTPLATSVEPRQGVGCLVRQGPRWRYRHVPVSALDSLSSWLTAAGPEARRAPGRPYPAAVGEYAPVPAEQWLDAAQTTPYSVRATEDLTCRAVAVADTEGVRAASESRTLRHRVEASVVVDGNRYRGLSRWLRRDDGEIEHPGGAHLTAVALEHARNASRATVGGKHRTPVVFGPSAAAGFLHELIGHSLEGDNFAIDSAYLAALRRPGAVPAVLSLRDDPTVPHGYGSFGIDDEGAAACVTTLVEKGELGQPLTSVRAVHRNGYAPRGNGRRRSYREPAIPRASNTVVLPGSDDPAALLAPHGTGLLLVGCLGAGMINLVTGEFSFAGLNCSYLTPGGELLPVRDVSLVGDALEALARLEGVGSDFAGDNVTCGKQGQLVGIGVYSPSMRYAALDWSAA